MLVTWIAGQQGGRWEEATSYLTPKKEKKVPGVKWRFSEEGSTVAAQVDSRNPIIRSDNHKPTTGINRRGMCWLCISMSIAGHVIATAEAVCDRRVSVAFNGCQNTEFPPPNSRPCRPRRNAEVEHYFANLPRNAVAPPRSLRCFAATIAGSLSLCH